MRYWSGTSIEDLPEDGIFVFGSNPSGIHGKGAAKQAVKFGAMYGKGRGLYGKSYALITKNLKSNYIETLSNGDTLTYTEAGRLSVSSTMIIENIIELYDCCRVNPDKRFFVAYKNDNNNLNGYSSLDIFNMFTLNLTIPDNIYFHTSFRKEK